MNRAKTALVRSKKFVSDHRVALAVTATAIVTTIVVRKTVGNMYESARDFIDEKGLLDEYYSTFEDITDL